MSQALKETLSRLANTIFSTASSSLFDPLYLGLLAISSAKAAGQLLIPNLC